MIIFYNKKSGEIYGSISGRVHDDNVVNNALIAPSEVAKEDVGRYIVSYKQKVKTIKLPMYKNVVNPKTLEVVKIKVGEKESQVGDGLEIDDKLKPFIEKLENNQTSISSHTFKIKNGKVVGTEERVIGQSTPKPVDKESLDSIISELRKEIGALKTEVSIINKKLNANKSGIINE